MDKVLVAESLGAVLSTEIDRGSPNPVPSPSLVSSSNAKASLLGKTPKWFTKYF